MCSASSHQASVCPAQNDVHFCTFQTRMHATTVNLRSSPAFQSSCYWSLALRGNICFRLDVHISDTSHPNFRWHPLVLLPCLEEPTVGCIASFAASGTAWGTGAFSRSLLLTIPYNSRLSHNYYSGAGASFLGWSTGSIWEQTCLQAQEDHSLNPEKDTSSHYHFLGFFLWCLWTDCAWTNPEFPSFLSRMHIQSHSPFLRSSSVSPKCQFNFQSPLVNNITIFNSYCCLLFGQISSNRPGTRKMLNFSK